MKGSTYRRCYCRGEDGKPLGKACPKLSSRRHGTYAIRQELPARADGSRRSFSRSGYASAKEAQEALDTVRALLAIPDGDDAVGQVQIGDLLEKVSKDKKASLPELDETRRRFHSGQNITSTLTVADWLDQWLAGKRIRKSGVSRYEMDIRVHLRPRIGHVRLDRLRVSHLSEMFTGIIETNAEIEENNAQRRTIVEELKQVPWKGADNRARRKALKDAIDQMPPFRRATGPATRLRIRATLRAALNDAIAQQVMPVFNPAAHVELDPVRRPKAIVWNAEWVEQWRKTGRKPGPVMVWTPEQTGQFLHHIAQHRLYALWHVVAFRGLRRGEACGQGWADVDLDGGLLTVGTQLVQDGWEVYEDVPKTDSGARVIALDSRTVEVLRAHRRRQEKERAALGEAWVDTGRVFTQETGEWLHPGWLSDEFERLVASSGLPPVRLHDLRHGAATLIHAGGGDLHTIKETLGHSGIAITSDTYTSLLPQVDKEVAEAAARLVQIGAPSKATYTAAHASLTHEAVSHLGAAGEVAREKESPQVTCGEMGR